MPLTNHPFHDETLRTVQTIWLVLLAVEWTNETVLIAVNFFFLFSLFAYLKTVIYVFGTALRKTQSWDINFIKYFALQNKS